jgi:hypothetical protein
MPCPGPREVTSTVTEHETVAARDHVSTNAPGRIEGSREHSNLAVTSRNAACTDTTSASSRGQPRGRDPHARGQTRQSPRLPRRHGASHDLACRDFSPRTCRTLRAHLDDLHARGSPSCASILVTPPSSSDKSLEHADDGCHAPGRVRSRARSPSTRLSPLAITSPTNAPGRIEGSREHSSLAVPSGTQHARPRRPRPHDTSDVGATHTHEGRRDARLGHRSVAARTTRVRVEPPLGPARRFARTSSIFTHDARSPARRSS